MNIHAGLSVGQHRLPENAAGIGGNAKRRAQMPRLLPYVLLALAFAVSLALRPVIPIDETRYLTAAWEMWLRRNFLEPTVNFAPYFEKPPLLFWLIDLSWSILGVSRASALVPVYAISATVIHLTSRLALNLLPGEPAIAQRASWLISGNLVFLAYSSFVLFDLLLTACALGAVLALLAHARGGLLRHAAAAGLLAGVGVLAKGPVVLIHIAWPAMLLPLLGAPINRRRPGMDPAAIPMFLSCAALPVAAWIVPLAAQSDWETLHRLVWLQSFGRVTGNVEDAHSRPFHFYLPLLPLFVAPWFGVGGFWRGLGSLARSRSLGAAPFRFAVLWSIGVVATFSVISGKQPHYLVPILPPVTVALAWLMRGVTTRRLRLAALVSLVLLTGAHLVARFTLLPANDLTDVARLMRRTGGEWAATARYRGELNFLARLERPLAVVAPQEARAWLSHAGPRYLVDLNGTVEGAGDVLLGQPYRRGRLRIFQRFRGPALDPR